MCATIGTADDRIAFDQLVRETLLQLRETARLLVQQIESGKAAKP